jgi:hypothetical protein
MQTFRVDGYDMAFLEVGQGPPLVEAPEDYCRVVEAFLAA